MDIVVNGQPKTFEQTLSVAELLVQLGFTSLHLAVARNDAVVPRSQHAKTRVTEGDRIEIIRAVGGG